MIALGDGGCGCLENLAAYCMCSSVFNFDRSAGPMLKL